MRPWFPTEAPRHESVAFQNCLANPLRHDRFTELEEVGDRCTAARGVVRAREAARVRAMKDLG
jgi:hypothetical protein